jgi:hypothetical protein
VRIWTAQRTYITALRHSGKFTETRSGFYGTTEWSPGDRCEAGQQPTSRRGWLPSGWPCAQTLMLCGQRIAFRRSGL